MLDGRTAVITGGSRGIGKAVSLKLAENGANIAVIFQGSAEAAKEVCGAAIELGVEARCYQCDVSDFAAAKNVCENIFSDFGRVDILINNAGITRDNLLLKMSEEDFDSVVNVNLKGGFNFAKHLCRYIMKSDCGRIINISSVIGITGNGGQTNYASAKAGLIGLTKSLAKELAARGVTCNAIAPGYIQTDMTAELPLQAMERISTSIPLKRVGEAREVASLALFLASDAASYITGEVIRVDGGMCI